MTSRPEPMAPSTSASDEQRLEDLLGLPARRRRPWRWGVVVVGLLLITLAVVRREGPQRTQAPLWETQAAEMGSLVVTVSATGHLRPINQVDVGTEISGLVELVTVDDNDRVQKDQVLARLDDSRLRDQIARSEATLATARARVRQATAGVGEARSRLERLRHVERLSGGKVPSPLELDGAVASLERALADEASAKASVEEAQAQLSSERILLSKATIRSPIAGIVLARHVEPGQTVAASLQAPVLFTLAEDLADMELQVDVDEADVGAVEVDQPASFRVDAYPARVYEAGVERVGFGSQLQDGVVSYLTTLSVDNRDLSLRPGMTATAEILVESLDNVLLVPNAALRFRPPMESTDSRSFVSRLTPRPPSVERREGSGQEPAVWIVEEDQSLRRVPIQAGASDGRWTHVQSGELKPGVAVVTAERMVG